MASDGIMAAPNFLKEKKVSRKKRRDVPCINRYHDTLSSSLILYVLYDRT